MRNMKLIVSYDGSAYLGWQKTRMGQSIEQTLQNVIERIVQHSVHLQAASRTDSGVHANGQVVNFTTSKIHLDLEKFCVSLNSLLPKDIVVLRADWMPASFHPTLDCICKEYRYFICFGPKQLPHHRFYSWHVPHLLNLAAIQEAIPLIIGKHNFAAFCNVKKNEHYKDHVREVQLLELIEIERRVYFRIRGNHFLYKMVRNIVGTLVNIGRGKIAFQTLPSILESQSRPQAGITAPSHGLFLYKLFY
jgi:tRNA pseudouridine38-40 synthase